MNKLISVIIPIYNTEQYLPKCLDSLLSQDYPYFEVLLINDGSTDNSEAVCRTYVNQDKRFRYCHLENSGPSKARNYGLGKAEGEYVLFLDSDDYLHKDALGSLVAIIKDSDLAAAAYQRVEEDEGLCKKQFSAPEGMLTQKEMLHFLLYEQKYGFLGYIYPKLYKRSIISEAGIRFDETLKHNEDRLFFTEYVLHSNSFIWINKPVYCYRQRDNSLVHSVRPDNFSEECLHELLGFEKMKKLFQKDYREEWYRTSRLIFEKSLYWYRIIPSAEKAAADKNKKMLNENTRICLSDPNQTGKERLKVLAHWVLKR